jgi:hypothetical protein
MSVPRTLRVKEACLNTFSDYAPQETDIDREKRRAAVCENVMLSSGHPTNASIDTSQQETDDRQKKGRTERERSGRRREQNVYLPL